LSFSCYCWFLNLTLSVHFISSSSASQFGCSRAQYFYFLTLKSLWIAFQWLQLGAGYSRSRPLPSPESICSATIELTAPSRSP
jgi:hypothetical protein